MKMLRQRTSFTLIELLIVIAIIAILAGMLLPALKKARDSAKKIQCATNLKQVGTCWLSYIDDNQGFLPPAWWEGLWTWKLCPYIGNLEKPPSAKYPAAPQSTIFTCPSNTSYYTTGSTTQWSFSVNYAMNVACGVKWTAGGGAMSQKAGNISNPSQAYIITDGASIDDNGKGAKSVWVWTQKEAPDHSGFIHGSGHPAGATNIMFADGHVGSSRFSGIILGNYDVYRSRIIF
ncbi:MAG: hypothetical protein A2020_03655 [Lentisphaerae bacterium GWF2_45_14]|nr:MAG: hypothetical protein A2020_03655 [Lentisphaerae bacterium GWF2_45_14]